MTSAGESHWSMSDWSGWIQAQAGAAVACGVAWYAAAGHTDYSDQMAPSDLAVAGLTVSLVAHAWLLVKGRKRIGERRTRLVGQPQAPLRDSGPVGAVPADAQPPRERATVVVGGDDNLFYHRPECPMAVGRNWPHTSIAVQEAATRNGCGMCQP